MWEDYSISGTPIPKTPFIAIKTPLKKEITGHLSKKVALFKPCMVLKLFPNVGLVVDLTNTYRYYNKEQITRLGIAYEKIQCPGRMLPPDPIVSRFYSIVDDFISTSSSQPGQSKLIAVHCTHGLNRTGYLLCRYLIEKMGFTPLDAINAFESARGHKMERQNYINELMKCIPNVISIQKQSSSHVSGDIERDRSLNRGCQMAVGRPSAQPKCDNFRDDYSRRGERSRDITMSRVQHTSRSRHREEDCRSRGTTIPPMDQIDWADY